MLHTSCTWCLGRKPKATSRPYMTHSQLSRTTSSSSSTFLMGEGMTTRCWLRWVTKLIGESPSSNKPGNPLTHCWFRWLSIRQEEVWTLLIMQKVTKNPGFSWLFDTVLWTKMEKHTYANSKWEYLLTFLLLVIHRKNTGFCDSKKRQNVDCTRIRVPPVCLPI